jgi:hypothetical protein
MSQLFTKSEFAKSVGVTPSALSNWVKRRQLTAPALRSDGKIDAGLAVEQLRVSLHPVMSARARQRGDALPMPKAAPAASAEILDMASGRKLLAARAEIATVQAERGRRELEHERGRYTLAEGAKAAFAQALAEFLQRVEQNLGDLARDLGLDQRQAAALRTWWRAQRASAAAEARAKAATLPEFIEGA